jgi:hypothetical protein
MADLAALITLQPAHAKFHCNSATKSPELLIAGPESLSVPEWAMTVQFWAPPQASFVPIHTWMSVGTRPHESATCWPMSSPPLRSVMPVAGTQSSL